jgi:lipoprotein-releasing system permease protein
MILSFARYFFTYMFRAHTRQKILFLAMVGPCLSAMALFILQSIMGGLQSSLIKRSKMVEGHGQVELYGEVQQDLKAILSIWNEAKQRGLKPVAELEMEMLLQFQDQNRGSVVHGISEEWGIPPVIEPFWKGETILGDSLGHKLQANPSGDLTFISPSHGTSLLGEIPRQVTSKISNLIDTQIPEINTLHSWTRLSLLHNLIRERSINRLKLFSGDQDDLMEFKLWLTQWSKEKNIKMECLIFKTWEEMNEALMWALNLENKVMLILFLSMSALVALAILSAFLIFFDKIRVDLLGLWLLGARPVKIRQATFIFINLLSFATVSSGLLIGTLILLGLDYLAPNIMPEVFVDQKLPVHMTLQGLFISFIFPYLISVIFTSISLKNIQREASESSYLELLRNVT